MPRSVSTLSLLLVAGGLTACATSPSAPTVEALVTVQESTVDVVVTTISPGASVNFEVPLRITNTGEAPLAYLGCNSRIEEQSGTEWRLAWESTCAYALVGGAHHGEIPVGESRDFILRVRGTTDGITPGWKVAGIDGVYRVAAGLTFPGRLGAPTLVTSNAFTLSSGN